jgi:hypothetical protein
MLVRSKALVGVAGAVVVAGVTVFAVAMAGDGRTSAGPPTGQSLHAYPPVGGSSHELGGGDVTFGIQVLTLERGAKPVTITGVELVNPHGLTLVEERLADPHRPVYQFLSVPRLPPVHYNPVTVTALGATIDSAKRGWQLQLGMRVSPATLAKMDGIRVEYRVEGQGGVEQQVFPVTFVVCTEESQLKRGRCPAPDISGDQNESTG